MDIPQRFVRIKQQVDVPQIDNARKAVIDSLREIGADKRNFKGQTVGITAGSRGIDRIPEILSAVAEMIQDCSGRPVIIPSMGTHGGATVERQLSVLTSLGITREAVGCPVLECVESVLIGETSEGIPVHCNLEATKVDHLVIVNRVKPHTDFSGCIESGICKMMAIGLGSYKGAETAHSYARIHGHEKVITSVAKRMLEKLPVAFAIGITENYKGKTARLQAMEPERIMGKEKKLLDWVKEKQIKLPFDSMGVLVVGEIGKNISGTGMDTKVIGRIMVKGQKEPELPKIECIAVLSLTSESHGNACGIGLADITTKRVLDAVDLYVTGYNSIASMAPEQGRLPCVVSNDYEAIHSAISTLGAVSPEKARVVYIQNTNRLERLAVSESMLDEVEAKGYLEVISRPEKLEFDGEGTLLNFKDGV